MEVLIESVKKANALEEGKRILIEIYLRKGARAAGTEPLLFQS
jgi:hypothetical protein